MQKIKDWIWDKLFLDFYLDKRFTLKFKFVNLLYGDYLRNYLAFLGMNLRDVEKQCNEGEYVGYDEETNEPIYRPTDEVLAWRIHRAVRDMNDVWDLFLRPKYRTWSE